MGFPICNLSAMGQPVEGGGISNKFNTIWQTCQAAMRRWSRGASTRRSQVPCASWKLGVMTVGARHSGTHGAQSMKGLVNPPATSPGILGLLLGQFTRRVSSSIENRSGSSTHHRSPSHLRLWRSGHPVSPPLTRRVQVVVDDRVAFRGTRVCRVRAVGSDQGESRVVAFPQNQRYLRS